MNTKLQTISSELKEKLWPLINSDQPEDFQSVTMLVDNGLLEMRKHITEEAFFNEAEEIQYFKEIRPNILAMKIEAALQFNLIINRPIGTVTAQINYFEDALKGLQSFLHFNAFYHQYYRNRAVELDSIYFIRNSAPLKVPVQESSEADIENSTPMSDLFAKFIAYEEVQRFILRQVNALLAGENLVKEVDINSSKLKWTGDVVNIVELAYGIWLTGQVNDGNASLNQIVRWLEAELQVNIGIAQRKFTEIVGRKRYSITKFIDQMKDAIMKKVQSNNE